MTTYIRPLADRVLIKEEPRDTTTRGGVILPDLVDNEKLKPYTGVIVAVGPGPRSPLTGDNAHMGLSEGQRVIYSMMTGAEMEVNGETLIALREIDIIAIIDTDPDEAPAAQEESAQAAS